MPDYNFPFIDKATKEKQMIKGSDVEIATLRAWQISPNLTFDIDTVYPERITQYGFIAELRTARKPCVCNQCRGVIRKREQYYRIFIGGGGLQSLKFPDRAHLLCIHNFLEKFRVAWEEQESHCSIGAKIN